MAADAAKQLAERMRVQAAIIEEFGSEEAFQKSRAHGEEAMRLIQIAERARQATEGYKY
jgi:DICT domain-containing protein